MRQLLLGCVYPTASLPGETIFEKQYRNLDPPGVWAFCRGDCRPTQAPAGHLTPLLYPLEAEPELFLAGSPSPYLTWIPPAVISVNVDSAILCLSFSGCRLSFTLGSIYVCLIHPPLSSVRPTPIIRSRLPCTGRRGFAGAGGARLTPFPHSLRCEREEAVHLVGVDARKRACWEWRGL